MRFEPGYLLGMALQTIPEPRKVAREVQALSFPRAVLWQAFALFVTLSTGLGVATRILMPVDPDMPGPIVSPLGLGLAEGVMMVLTALAIYRIGRAFGGTGTFDQALLTVIWLQFVMFLLSLTVLVVAMFSLGTAALIQLAGFALGFWILTFFVTEMHGFTSPGLVFVMILVTMMGAGFVMSILLVVTGLVPPELIEAAQQGAT